MERLVAIPKSVSSVIVLLGSILLIVSLRSSYSPSSLYSSFDGYLNGNQNKNIYKDYKYSVGETPKNLAPAFSPEVYQKSTFSTNEYQEVEKANNSSSAEDLDSKEPDALFSTVFVDNSMKNGSEIENYTAVYTNQSLKAESLTSPPVQNIVPGENAAKDYVKSDTRKCDLYHGKWVHDSSGPVYANNTCPILTQAQNCQGNGRPDKDYENWRWKPSQCELPRFNGRNFLEFLKGKTLAFVGDSLARNQMESLLCMLWQTEVPESRSYRRMHRWYFKSTSTTIIRIWSAWLVKKTDLPFQTSSPRAVNVHLDIPDTSFTDFLPNFDILVLSTGHWFTTESKYLVNNKTIAPRRRLRRKRKRISKKNQNNNLYFYGMALGTILNAIGSTHDYKGLTILRSYSPEHYTGGAWNNGGSCLGVDKVSNKPDISLYSSTMKKKQFEEFEKASKREKNGKFVYMDITEMSGYRHDGHPSIYSGRMENRNGRNKIEDCTHWCMPGPVDTWNEILFEVLKREL